jgi:hypothetical protein
VFNLGLGILLKIRPLGESGYVIWRPSCLPCIPGASTLTLELANVAARAAGAGRILDGNLITKGCARNKPAGLA